MPSNRGTWRERKAPAEPAAAKVQKASWRKKDAGSGASPRKPSTWWSRHHEQDIKRPLYYRRIRLGMMALLFIALVAAFVVAILAQYKTTPLLTLVVTEYENDLIPPNGYALEDAEHLSSRFKRTEGIRGRRNLTFSGDYRRSPTATTYWSHLSRQLDQATPGGPDKNILLLYISAHGLLNDRGEPCLLMQDADPWDSSTWVPLQDLLQKIASSGGDRSTKKVLFLDAGRITQEWPLGILYNGFADALVAGVEQVNDPNLVVVNAASPGEQAWSAPELQGSVFGHFLAAGLEGYADADRGGEIELAELLDYLEKKISSWTREHRDSPQHPLLIARSAEAGHWRLVHASVAPDKPSPENDEQMQTARAKADQQAAEIDGLWSGLQAAMHGAPYTVNPLDWARLQWMLVRLEQLNLAGRAYEEQFSRLRKDAELLLETFADAHVVREEQVYCLPLIEQLTGQLEDAERRTRYVNEWNDPKTRAAWPRQLNYATAASVGWQWLRDRQASLDDVRDVLRLVDRAAPSGDRDLIEMHQLRMFYKYLTAPEAVGQIGQAIETRHLAEAAAAPADERVHYWVQSLVEQGDDVRRSAEDKLFVETPASIREARQLFDEVVEADEGSYSRAIAHAGRIAEAYRTRDEAYAYLPHFASWAQTGLKHGTPAGSQIDTLYESIQATHELAKALDQGARNGQAADWTQVQPAYQQVEKTLAQLKSAYAEDLAALYRSGVDQHTIRDMAAILSIPVLSTGDTAARSREYRSELRSRLLQMVFSSSGDDRLVSGTRPADAMEQEKQAKAQAHEQFLATLAQRTPHPLLSLLDPNQLECEEQIAPIARIRAMDATMSEQDRERRITLLAAQEQELRRIFSQVEAATRELSQVSRRRLERKAEFQAADVREGFSRADRLTRAAAVALSGRPWFGADEDPALGLRRLDRHYHFLWQAERTLEDFWGPRDTGSEPFFAVATRGYLGAAQKWARQDDPQLRQLLSDRVAAAEPRGGLRPQADDVRFLEDQELVDHLIAFERSGNIPSGEAAVFLRPYGHPGTRVEVVPGDQSDQQPVRSFAVPIQGEAPPPVNYQIRQTGFEHTTMLEAIAFYRGHVRMDEFPVSPAGPGNDVLVLSKGDEPPVITVAGDSKSPGALLLIFDCSGSMSQSLGNDRSVTKYDIARDALNAILRRLPKNGYRVGLMVYGHSSRAMEENEAKARQLPVGTFIGPDLRATKLHPNDAVELKLAPRKLLDEALRAEIDGHLAQLRPWGQTPLYASIQRGLDEIATAGPASSKHVVVLTDGFDEVLSSGTSVKAIDVEKKLKQHRDVRIDIVGFDMKKEESEHEDDHVTNLRRIAQATGGSYQGQARDPSSLIRALEKALQPVEYKVFSVGSPVPPDLLPLGETWFLNDWVGPADYEVRLAGTDRPVSPHRLKLEGGEAIELQFDQQRNQLVHRLYEPPYRQPVKATSTAENLYHVSAFMPTRNGNEVTFYVAIQNAQHHQFSPRPKRVWCEITPTDYAEQPADVPVYNFYDVEYQSGVPVPVLIFRVPNWPRTARQGRIQVWFAPEDVAGKSIDLQQAGQQLFTVEGLAGAEFKVLQRTPSPGVLEVIVEQRHGSSASGSDLYSTRVRVAPDPDQIIHRYIPDAFQVRHIFRYSGSRRPQAVEITPRSQVTSNTVTLVRPIEVVPEK